jgi:hypothetical protein
MDDVSPVRMHCPACGCEVEAPASSFAHMRECEACGAAGWFERIRFSDSPLQPPSDPATEKRQRETQFLLLRGIRTELEYRRRGDPVNAWRWETGGKIVLFCLRATARELGYPVSSCTEPLSNAEREWQELYRADVLACPMLLVPSTSGAMPGIEWQRDLQARVVCLARKLRARAAPSSAPETGD